MNDYPRLGEAHQDIWPHAAGVYVNFLVDEGEQHIHKVYPAATYTQLTVIKSRYDPTNC